ncbi:hypothetical protein GCM10010358_47250 [Streptomyces minutiscleroticus]|uniref:Uncharacterized protein n=1 Tax=Streptomyces minutiscleroticus TaxID=68238 RepID=A0A918NQB0_9ACTN|nr:hypothetical protein GCM10010358_47250 [Streptomyces minutiscleroticus]
MVDVADGADVDVRLGALELRLGHCEPSCSRGWRRACAPDGRAPARYGRTALLYSVLPFAPPVHGGAERGATPRHRRTGASGTGALRSTARPDKGIDGQMLG